MSELAGMTINERLFHIGLLKEFDAAILAREEREAVAILLRAELSKEQAQNTVAAIFSDPGMYGYA